MIEEKYENLKKYIRDMGSVAVAFSGGVDSTFLLKVAHDELGDKAIAVTAKSISFPEREHKESEEFCRDNGINQYIVYVDQMAVEGFKDNPPDRCYLCKKKIFDSLTEEAVRHGITCIAEGSNADDSSDYRPGMRAIKELGVHSPLQEAGLKKAEIRELSRRLGLPTWSKPSFACLATRFPYGDEITSGKIKMVDEAEQLLMDLGFSQMRCRVHGDVARIEVPQSELPRFLEPQVRDRILSEFRRIGFMYVSADLAGYETGSMNKMLDEV